MTAKVIGIGNSSGIVIPTALMASLGLKRNDKVTIVETPNGFEVKKTNSPRTFEELMENYYAKPFEEAITQFKNEGDDVEIDWGEPKGEEL